MAPYYPLLICRSDGQFEVATRSNVKEVNQPTAQQMDDTPDANGNVDCYRKLEVDDAKHVDWRRKLGGMLMHLFDREKEHAGKSHLVTLSPSTTDFPQTGTIFSKSFPRVMYYGNTSNTMWQRLQQRIRKKRVNMQLVSMSVKMPTCTDIRRAERRGSEAPRTSSHTLCGLQ
jgi:hypothetical protein